MEEIYFSTDVRLMGTVLVGWLRDFASVADRRYLLIPVHQVTTTFFVLDAEPLLRKLSCTQRRSVSFQDGFSANSTSRSRWS
jgi:hypothetical protein